MTDREQTIAELLYMKHDVLEGSENDKTIDKAIIFLKLQEAVKPYMDFDGKDVWQCGNCGARLFHPSYTQVDEEIQNYIKFCRRCGKKVKWDNDSLQEDRERVHPVHDRVYPGRTGMQKHGDKAGGKNG